MAPNAVQIRLGPDPIVDIARMRILEHIELDKLTLVELRELRNDIDAAIRAIIRERAQAKDRMASPPPTAEARKIDLASERDAWIAARRR